MDDESLTPWQKEHLLYLEKTGQSSDVSQELPEDEELFHPETINVALDESEKLADQEETSAERVSFADRLPKMKKYRNQKLFRRVLIISILFLLPLLFTIYYVSPLSKLSEVTVAGNQNIANEDIVDASGFEIGAEIWPQYFEREAAVTKIKQVSPRIKQVDIKIGFLNHLIVTIEEHQEVALLIKGKDYLPILDNGKIVEEPQKEVDEGKVIFENFTDEAKILSTLKAYNKLSAEIQESIAQIKYAATAQNDQLLNLSMKDGNQVIVNISNMASQMPYYPQVAKELGEKGIVDMEVGIFASPYPSSETTSSETNEETKESDEETNF